MTAASDLAEAVRILRALREKMKKVDSLLRAEAGVAWAHGFRWPSGDENNWGWECAEADDCLTGQAICTAPKKKRKEKP